MWKKIAIGIALAARYFYVRQSRQGYMVEKDYSASVGTLPGHRSVRSRADTARIQGTDEGAGGYFSSPTGAESAMASIRTKVSNSGLTSYGLCGSSKSDTRTR